MRTVCLKGIPYISYLRGVLCWFEDLDRSEPGYLLSYWLRCVLSIKRMGNCKTAVNIFAYNTYASCPHEPFLYMFDFKQSLNTKIVFSNKRQEHPEM